MTVEGGVLLFLLAFVKVDRVTTTSAIHSGCGFGSR